ncbi:hypothetical protein BJV82DRAFT_584324 [Fennellomyces sp. T-0311]|nr:hypothetical protein BJV82DRAFT_584324 [Fennellomyces sp. T-0311]
MSLPELPEHDFESLFYEQQLDEDTTEITIAPKYIWTSTYSQKQVGALLDLCKNQGLSPHVAGSKLGMKKTAAYEFYNEALRNPAVLPGYKLASEVHRGNNRKFGEDHRNFIDALVAWNPTLTIDEIHYQLSEAFPVKWS